MTTEIIEIKITGDSQGGQKALKETEKRFAGLKKVGQEFFKGIAVGVGTVTAFGVAAKKAFDFTKEGAGIAQTRQSFDLLLQKVGAAPDLLNQLSAASLKTIDDMTLMSSTLTLVAGAEDELAQSLAGATPQLVEIAKAANKLNPTLGDTAFLYESLGTGIKRASPMILDNLGLTIRVGEANQRYADALGKSVDELTATEQKQALLNETLRAGDVLIKQVGGSVDSLTDKFARAETATKNWMDDLKAGKNESLNPLIDWWTEATELDLAFNDAVEQGRFIHEGFYRVLDTETGKVISRWKAEGLLYDEMVENQEITDYWIARSAKYQESIADAAAEMEELAEETADAAAAAEEAQRNYENMFDAASQDWGGIFDDFSQGIDFVLGGGLAFEEFGTVVENTGIQFANMTEEARDRFGPAIQEVIDRGTQAWIMFQQEQGKLSFRDTIDQLQELGYTYTEAAEIAQRGGAGWESLLAAQEGRLAGILAYLNSINGLHAQASVSINYKTSGVSGLTAVGAGGAAVSNKTPAKYVPKAAGGPVKAGESYMVGENGVEAFIPDQDGVIIPNHELGTGGPASPFSMGGGGTINVYYSPTVSLASPQEFEDRIYPLIERAIRQRERARL